MERMMTGVQSKVQTRLQANGTIRIHIPIHGISKKPIERENNPWEDHDLSPRRKPVCPRKSPQITEESVVPSSRNMQSSLISGTRTSLINCQTGISGKYGTVVCVPVHTRTLNSAFILRFLTTNWRRLKYTPGMKPASSLRLGLETLDTQGQRLDGFSLFHVASLEFLSRLHFAIILGLELSNLLL